MFNVTKIQVYKEQFKNVHIIKTVNLANQSQKN